MADLDTAVFPPIVATTGVLLFGLAWLATGPLPPAVRGLARIALSFIVLVPLCFTYLAITGAGPFADISRGKEPRPASGQAKPGDSPREELTRPRAPVAKKIELPRTLQSTDN